MSQLVPTWGMASGRPVKDSYQVDNSETDVEHVKDNVVVGLFVIAIVCILMTGLL